MTAPDALPSFRELPVKQGAPPGSAWGLWGDEDEIGTLNLLTDERTRRAAQRVRRGSVFPLNLPLELNAELAWRVPPVHKTLHIGPTGPFPVGVEPGDREAAVKQFRYRDDSLDALWLQGGSQWDGLTHVRHASYGNYNDVPDDAVHDGDGAKLGIDQWARRTIVGRAVLLDLQRHLERLGRPYDPTSAHSFTVADLEEAAEAQRTQIETGDVLLLHFGWTQRYVDADSEERKRMTAWGSLTAPGLEQSEQMIEHLWDLHVAAVATDTLGVEMMDLRGEYEFVLHEHLLPLFGMPIGEMWALHDLAADCANDGAYEFMFVSVPLNVRGGVGSPPQAVAIK
jgi:kynurenine formamidase